MRGVQTRIRGVECRVGASEALLVCSSKISFAEMKIVRQWGDHWRTVCFHHPAKDRLRSYCNTSRMSNLIYADRLNVLSAWLSPNLRSYLDRSSSPVSISSSGL